MPPGRARIGQADGERGGEKARERQEMQPLNPNMRETHTVVAVEGGDVQSARGGRGVGGNQGL